MNRVAAIQKSSRTMHDGLDVLAVALPQGGDQLGVRLAPPGEEPLLELVEHEQHLLAGPAAPRPRRRAASVSTRSESRRQVGARLPQRLRAAGPRSRPAVAST